MTSIPQLMVGFSLPPPSLSPCWTFVWLLGLAITFNISSHGQLSHCVQKTAFLMLYTVLALKNLPPRLLGRSLSSGGSGVGIGMIHLGSITPQSLLFSVSYLVEDFYVNCHVLQEEGSLMRAERLGVAIS